MLFPLGFSWWEVWITERFLQDTMECVFCSMAFFRNWCFLEFRICSNRGWRNQKVFSFFIPISSPCVREYSLPHSGERKKWNFCPMFRLSRRGGDSMNNSFNILRESLPFIRFCHFFLASFETCITFKKEDMYFFLAECGRSGSLRRREKTPIEEWGSSDSCSRRHPTPTAANLPIDVEGKLPYSPTLRFYTLLDSVKPGEKSKRTRRMKHPCIHYYFPMRSDFIKINIL